MQRVLVYEDDWEGRTLLVIEEIGDEKSTQLRRVVNERDGQIEIRDVANIGGRASKELRS
jgi:hypothetical protein